LISHTGRATGRTYQTPVVAVPTDQGYVIALPYGTQSNWVKNVLANGSATVVHTGKTSRVDQPELIPMDEVKAHFPPKDQRGHDFFKVTQCLRVRRVESIDRHAGPTPPSAPGSDIRTDGPVRDDLEASGVR
jgi:deazaflavin-dependent oxidoreductase (nitroreductase family)